LPVTIAALIKSRAQGDERRRQKTSNSLLSICNTLSGDNSRYKLLRDTHNFY
jgi:hypothetical protein